MGHTHSHEHDSDSYYLDQLCLIAISGAFAGVCLTLYFWQTQMLGLMLAPQFHKFVLWSGVALLVLVVVRAATLWRDVGRAEQAHAHGHACGHDHDHNHAHEHGHHHHHHHAHEGGHGPAAVAEADPPPALPQEHAHTHEHGHGHDCCGHDHGWAPWRYVVLLLPIMLYLIGEPSKGPSVEGVGEHLALGGDVQAYVQLVGLSTSPLQPLGLATAVTGGGAIDESRAQEVGLRELDGAAYDPASREIWQGRVVRILGQYAPTRYSDRIFAVVRYRIQCCQADAIPIPIACACGQGVGSLAPNTWVTVTGRVTFRERSPGVYVTVLQVPSRDNVKTTSPDPNPYIQ